MLNLEIALLNAGVKKVQDVFLSTTCLNTLQALDKEYAKQTDIIELILKTIPPIKILRDKKMRNVLLESLKKDSAINLAKNLYDLIHRRVWPHMIPHRPLLSNPPEVLSSRD